MLYIWVPYITFFFYRYSRSVTTYRCWASKISNSYFTEKVHSKNLEKILRRALSMVHHPYKFKKIRLKIAKNKNLYKLYSYYGYISVDIRRNGWGRGPKFLSASFQTIRTIIHRKFRKSLQRADSSYPAQQCSLNEPWTMNYSLEILTAQCGDTCDNTRGKKSFSRA